MNIRNYLIGLMLISLGVLVSACGGSGDANSNHTNNEAKSLSSIFFPVQAGDVHELQRTNAQGVVQNFHQTVDPIMDLGGNSVFPFTTRDDNGEVVHVDYYGTDVSKGVNLCGWDDIEHDFTARYTTCLFLPALMEGESFSGSATAEGTGKFASLARMDYTMTLEDFGSVTVPAGTFNACATSKVEISHFDGDGNTLEQGIFKITLCPNVGFVQIMHQGLSIGAATTRLVSGVVGGVPISAN